MSDPVQLLLRVVAAGVGGMPARRLFDGMWPEASEREARHRLEDCRRCLALLMGSERPPVSIDGDVARIDRQVLDVDSLELESSLAPLLEAFAELPAAERDRAQAVLAQRLDTGLVFLAGFESPWAESARYRIADSVARAAKRLAIGPGAGAGPANFDGRSS